MFLSEFRADLSRYKEKQLHCTRYKKNTFSTAILHPFGLGHQNFNTWDLTFRLHMPVKLYPDLLRFARVICEKPIVNAKQTVCKYCSYFVKSFSIPWIMPRDRRSSSDPADFSIPKQRQFGDSVVCGWKRSMSSAAARRDGTGPPRQRHWLLSVVAVWLLRLARSRYMWLSAPVRNRRTQFNSISVKWFNLTQSTHTSETTKSYKRWHTHHSRHLNVNMLFSNIIFYDFFVIFSERELTSTFAICYRPSVCRL